MKQLPYENFEIMSCCGFWLEAKNSGMKLIAVLEADGEAGTADPLQGLVNHER